MRLKPSIADARVSYAASEHLDVNVIVRNTTKTGSQPGAGTFGFSDAVELPVPVDTRTTDLGAALEFANADLSYTPTPHTALRAGYTIEKAAQTFRTFDTTTEHTLRLSADLAGTNWPTVRGVYEHAKRTGQGFDDQVLDDIGEQTSPRQFDISDRGADRLSAIVMVTTSIAITTLRRVPETLTSIAQPSFLMIGYTNRPDPQRL